MKLLLINPPFATLWPLGLSFGEPLGLAYVAAAVEASGRHWVQILDGVAMAAALPNTLDGNRNWIGISHDDLLAAMAPIDFDAVGLSFCRTSALDTGVETLIGRIRATYPNTPIIAGGPEVSHFWERYSNNRDIDYIVRGEGEKTIVDLLDALDGRMPLSAVKGIVRRDAAGGAVVAPDQDIVPIDSIPWPARHLLDMSAYIENRPTTEYRAATILTSRACPYQCAFCSTIQIWGNRWRGRSAADVVDEIEFLHREYRIEEIRVQDDNFCVKRSRVHDICDLLHERGIKVRLHVDPGIMSSLANRDLLSKLHRTGMNSINMQLESGCPKTQEYISKKIDLTHMRDMVAFAQGLGMFVRSNIIIGFPFETEADIRQSVRTAIDIGFDFIDFNYIDPKRDTRVWRDFVKSGILAQKDEEVDLPVPTLHCSAAQVRDLRQWALEEFDRSKRTQPIGQSIILFPTAIRREEGLCFTATIKVAKSVGDSCQAPQRSPTRLYENGQPLGPAHAQHNHIRTLGGGLYSHWEENIFFSTSDNSDPASNGRTYLVEF
jgi:magnesium-protoporphyrin IX monomethyl ester (oxidative) cyclase